MTEQNAAQNPATSVQPEPPPALPTSSKQAEVVPDAHSTKLECSYSHQDKAKWTDKTMAFFTVFLFLAAVIQAIIFYKQWQEMHSGGDDTHALAIAAKTQADESAKQVDLMRLSLVKTDALIQEATEQANATKALAQEAVVQTAATQSNADATSDEVAAIGDASETTKQSLHISERAYVRATLAPSTASVTCPAGRGNQIYGATLTYQNFGRTPAIAVTVTGNLYLRGGPTEPRTPPPYEGLYGDTLAADATGSKPLCGIANSTYGQASEMAGIVAQKLGYRLIGFIQYKDIFGEIHSEPFCNYYPIQEGEFDRIKTC